MSAEAACAGPSLGMGGLLGGVHARVPSQPEGRLTGWFGLPLRDVRPISDGLKQLVTQHLVDVIKAVERRRYARDPSRRAFGFHSADAFISMLYLFCGGK